MRKTARFASKKNTYCTCKIKTDSNCLFFAVFIIVQTYRGNTRLRL